MGENYYQQMLQNIEDLIRNCEYEKAEDIIKEEMAMPFVPRNVLENLEQFKREAEFHLSKQKPLKVFNEDEFLQALKTGQETAAAAINSLANLNVRNYMDVIKKALTDSSIHHLIKVLLLQQLIDQQISEEVMFVSSEVSARICPSGFPKVLEQPAMNTINEYIADYCRKNPSFLQQCQLVAVNGAFDMYPKLIDSKDARRFACSAIAYAYRAYDDSDGLAQFLQDCQMSENDLFEFCF